MSAEVCEYIVDGPLGVDFYKFSLGSEDFEDRNGFLLSYFKSLLNCFNVIVDSARNFGPLQQSCLHNGLSNFKHTSLHIKFTANGTSATSFISANQFS